MPLRSKRSARVDVVAVVAVAAVDQDVALLQQLRQLVQRLVGERGRHHHPDRPRRGQLGDELLARVAPRAPSFSSAATESGRTS